MISMDYLFTRKKGIYIDKEAGWDDPDALNVLVAKDTKGKSVFVMLCRRGALTTSDSQPTAFSRTYFVSGMPKFWRIPTMSQQGVFGHPQG